MRYKIGEGMVCICPNNLYVVSSPLQLLNAIEAQKSQQAHSNNYLIILYKLDIEYNQMKAMIGDEWNKIYYFKQSKVFKIFYAFILFKLILVFRNNINFLYLGYPVNVRAHIANSINAEKIFLLDDGSATLIFAKNFKNYNYIKNNSGNWYDFFLAKKTSLNYVENVTFFTVYGNIDWPKNQIVINNYSHHRKKLKSNKKNLDVLFIGSPIGRELVSIDNEIVLINSMINRYKGKKIIYALHRFENLKYLEDKYSCLGVEFIQFDRAIEVALFHNNIYPEFIVSFCSSALVNLSHLMDAKFEVLLIPSRMMEINQSKKMDILYQNYQAQGINLIKL